MSASLVTHLALCEGFKALRLADARPHCTADTTCKLRQVATAWVAGQVILHSAPGHTRSMFQYVPCFNLASSVALRLREEQIWQIKQSEQVRKRAQLTQEQIYIKWSAWRSLRVQWTDPSPGRVAARLYQGASNSRAQFLASAVLLGCRERTRGTWKQILVLKAPAHRTQRPDAVVGRTLEYCVLAVACLLTRTEGESASTVASSC